VENAALRLVRILEKAKEEPAERVAAVAVWKRVLDVETDEELVEKFGLLMALTGEASREILESFPDSADIVRHWQTKLYQVFAGFSLGASPWSEVVAQIDKHTIHYLRLHAQLLERNVDQKRMSKSDFSEARSLLQAAIEEIKASELAPEIKIRIVERIRAIITAIENFEITGQDAVFDAFVLAVVETSMGKGKQAKSEKLKEGLGVLANLMTVAQATRELGAKLLEFFN
jgi:hypothetical protein